jgi:hypothetical protein
MPLREDRNETRELSSSRPKLINLEEQHIVFYEPAKTIDVSRLQIIDFAAYQPGTYKPGWLMYL